jgi:hypothetical protein
MIKIDRAGDAASTSSIDVLAPSDAALDELRAQFRARSSVQLPGFLGPGFFDEVSVQAERAEFVERHREFQFGHGEGEEDVGFVEGTLRDGTPPEPLMSFLVNDPRLIELISAITGCGPIGRFDGRVYRMDPSRYSGWHDDFGDNRMIAMSVNLTRELYGGGTLRLREKGSDRILHDTPNTGPGDALIFQISGDLEHCITPIEGTVSKMAFAGWFKSPAAGGFLEIPRG